MAVAEEPKPTRRRKVLVVAAALVVGVAGITTADRRIESNLDDRIDAKVESIRTTLADGELFRVPPQETLSLLRARTIDPKGPVRPGTTEVSFEFELSSWWRRPCVRVTVTRPGQVTARTRSQTGC